MDEREDMYEIEDNEIDNFNNPNLFSANTFQEVATTEKKDPPKKETKTVKDFKPESGKKSKNNEKDKDKAGNKESKITKRPSVGGGVKKTKEDKTSANNTYNTYNNINSSASYMKATASFNHMTSKVPPSTKDEKKNLHNDTFCYYDPFNKKDDLETDLITHGERVYMKNMAEKNLKLILEEKERKAKENKSVEVLSFKPNLQMTAYYQPSSYTRVNHLSETTCFKNKNISVEDSKMNENISLEDEIEVFKQKRVVLSPEKLEAHIERLYKDHEKKNLNIEKLKSQYMKEIYTYKPDTNSYELKEKKNFYERLNSWLNNKKVKDDERKELIMVDKNTERPLFTPDLTLTKNKKFDNSRAYSPRNTVSDFLHSDGMAGHQRRATLMNESLKNFKVDSEKINTSAKSKVLNEKNKAELFQKIFEILDYNQDGRISHEENFDEAMREVPQHIVHILQPLFEEFRENKEVLTLKEFIVSCGRLYNILEYYERSQLFQYIFYVKRLTSPRTVTKEKEKEEERKLFSGQPEIQQKSIKIFDKSDKYSGTTFLERNSKYLETRKRVMQEGLDEQLAKEKEICTFHPEVDWERFFKKQPPIPEVKEEPEPEPEEDERKKKIKKIKVISKV